MWTTMENTSPQEVSNAKVYLSNSGDNTLNGLVRNLVYWSKDTAGFSVIRKISNLWLS